MDSKNSLKFYGCFPLVFALLTAAGGCRMCSSPYDYSLSAYVDRDCDYRGSDPFYRSGSVLFGNHCRSCEFQTADFTNTENFGITTPVSMPVSGSSDRFHTSPADKPDHTLPDHTLPGSPIGIPSQPPQINTGSNTGNTNPTGNRKPDIPAIPPKKTPTLEELINRPRQETPVIPVIPPAKSKGNGQTIEPLPADTMHGTMPDTMPFMPNDRDSVRPALPQPPVTPPAIPSTIPPAIPSTIPPATPPAIPPVPVGTPESFSIESLRLLEPTADKIEIISIEDAAADTVVR